MSKLVLLLSFLSVVSCNYPYSVETPSEEKIETSYALIEKAVLENSHTKAFDYTGYVYDRGVKTLYIYFTPKAK